MGCYCCGCEEAYEKTRLDIANGIINTEANAILSLAKEIEAKLQTLAVQPFRTYDVPAWDSGDYSSYQRALEDVRQRRKLEKRPPVLKRMLKPHYEAAMLQAREFYSAQEEPGMRPDPDWWVVVGILACNAEALYGFKSDTEKLETRFRMHQHTTVTMQKELQSTGNNKPLETAAVDTDSRAKIDRLAAQLKQLEPFASECARLMREFYVDVDEALVQEALAKEAEEAKKAKEAMEPKECKPQEADPKEADPLVPQNRPAKSQKKPEAK